MRTERSEQPWTYAGHPIETLEAAEGSVPGPVCNDDLAQREPNPRQPGKLGRAGPVSIDQLTRLERSSLAHGAVALRSGGSRGEGGEELNLTWRLAGPGGEIPHGLTSHCQGEEE